MWIQFLIDFWFFLGENSTTVGDGKTNFLSFFHQNFWFGNLRIRINKIRRLHKGAQGRIRKSKILMQKTHLSFFNWNLFFSQNHIKKIAQHGTSDKKNLFSGYNNTVLGFPINSTFYTCWNICRECESSGTSAVAVQHRRARRVVHNCVAVRIANTWYQYVGRWF